MSSTQPPQAPPHPKDWDTGIDDYLAQNHVSCDRAVPITTGTSCYIWQLEGLRDAEATANGHRDGEVAILKCADSTPKYRPYPVSAERLRFEVKALRSRAVADACAREPSVRVPRVLRETRNGFIMSCVGETDLRAAYKDTATDPSVLDAEAIGARLGRWLGALHLAGIALGEDGWGRQHAELGQFYAPGGLAERSLEGAAFEGDGGGEETAGRVLAALRAPAPVHTLTPWDFRPMNVVVHFPGQEEEGNEAGKVGREEPGLAVVDWELCHYGDPSDDVRMWTAEVMILEAKFGDRGLLSAFLTAYRGVAGAALVDEAFVARVALSVGVYVHWLVPLNPRVWDCTEDDVAAWKETGLRYMRAGVDRDMAWLRQSCLKPLLE